MTRSRKHIMRPTHDPMSCTLLPVVTNLLQEIDDGMESMTTRIQEGRDYEDIATLDRHKPASQPTLKSSPSWTASSVRIQSTCLYQNGDISLIRRPNKAFLDALELWRKDASFGSGPSSRNFVDHSMWPQKGAMSPVLSFFRPCIVLGLKPILGAPHHRSSTLGHP